MNTTLYIARHGETQWNKVQRFQGQLDSDLTELGKLQCKQIAQALLEKKIDLIISSNLGRAIGSAEICKSILKAEIKVASALTERHLGHWQGEKIADISQEPTYTELLYKFTQLTPLGGESAIDCGQRIYNALEDVACEHKVKNILVIFHGEALRCFLALLGQKSERNAYDLFKNGCITRLNYSHSKAVFNLA